MNVTKKIFLALLVTFLIAQCFRPEKNDGSIESLNLFIEDTKPSQDVQVILTERCFNCHSDYTKYPWYSNITPLNYWFEDHIKHGKKHFNVSKWENYSIKKKDHKFEELIQEVEEKKMPLASYTYTHREVNLTEDQILKVVDWAKKVRVGYIFAPRPE